MGPLPSLAADLGVSSARAPAVLWEEPMSPTGILMSLALAGCGLFGGGARTQTMTSGSGVPAAEGTVRSSEGDNGNTNVAVRVNHLAPASKVASDATVYVVWIQARNGTVQNVGALRLDDDLEGTLETMTP